MRISDSSASHCLPQRSHVIPELQKDFAINAGTRNFAAPGRATSPERDGLHRVPTLDTVDTRHLEARLGRFISEHQSRKSSPAEPRTPQDTENLKSDASPASLPGPSRDRFPDEKDTSRKHEEMRNEFPGENDTSRKHGEVRNGFSDGKDASRNFEESRKGLEYPVATGFCGFGRGTPLQADIPVRRPGVSKGAGDMRPSARWPEVAKSNGPGQFGVRKNCQGALKENDQSSRWTDVPLCRPGALRSGELRPVKGRGQSMFAHVNDSPSRPPSMAPSWRDDY